MPAQVVRAAIGKRLSCLAQRAEAIFSDRSSRFGLIQRFRLDEPGSRVGLISPARRRQEC